MAGSEDRRASRAVKSRTSDELETSLIDLSYGELIVATQRRIQVRAPLIVAAKLAADGLVTCRSAYIEAKKPVSSCALIGIQHLKSSRQRDALRGSVMRWASSGTVDRPGPRPCTLSVLCPRCHASKRWPSFWRAMMHYGERVWKRPSRSRTALLSGIVLTVTNSATFTSLRRTSRCMPWLFVTMFKRRIARSGSRSSRCRPTTFR